MSTTDSQAELDKWYRDKLLKQKPTKGMVLSRPSNLDVGSEISRHSEANRKASEKALVYGDRNIPDGSGAMVSQESVKAVRNTSDSSTSNS